MPTPDKDLMTRLTELVADNGHQWKQIAPILSAEGYRDKRGKPYSDNYLRYRMKKHETANHEKSSESSEHGEHSEYRKPSERSDTSAPDIRDLAHAVISYLSRDEQLRSALRQVLGNPGCTTSGQQHEMPPQPERSTDRRWVKLAGTCDCHLVERFHNERRKLRLSVSQMLDYVLWNFFDKPRLSFQSERSEESEPQGEAL